MRVRALRKTDLLSATVALGIISASGAGFLYLAELGNKSTFQNNDPTPSLTEEAAITEPEATYEKPLETAPTVNDNSVTVTTENADCTKSSTEQTTTDEDKKTSSISTEVECKSNDDQSSSSVKIKSNTSQTSESESTTAQDADSTSNSSQNSIKIDL